MKRLVLICAALIGCAGESVFRTPSQASADASPEPEASFVPTDKSFKIEPRGQPSLVLLEENELGMTEPFRAVGILQLEGKETKQLTEFYAAAAKAGASVGCDVIYQRDAFELGSRVVRPQLPDTSDNGIGGFMRNSGRDWKRSDRVLWQFVCGVHGASDVEQRDETIKRAVAVAVELRRKALGQFEPCDPYTPTGSHVRHRDVCANDPSRKRNVAEAPTTVPPGP